MKPYSILIVLFFILLKNTFSQENQSYFYFYESINDSIDISNNFYDYSDSLLYIFNDTTFFCEWDTNKVHYKGMNWNEFGDSIVLPLLISQNQKYAHPFEDIVTSKYGRRRNRFHYGIDVNLNVGDSVRNSFDGFVRYTGYNGGYGNVVVVRHLNGLETVYAHLSKILVETGKFIQAGEYVGLGGRTGRSTGAHLHFEVRFLGVAINPQHIIDFKEYTLISDTLILLKKSFSTAPNVPPNISVAKIGSDGQAQEMENPVYHTIRKGETLGHIATRYKTTVAKLCQLNGISRNAIIREGRKLRVR